MAELREVGASVNEEAVEAIEELLSRVKSGEVLAVAYVAVEKRRSVAYEYVLHESGTYHMLNSGVARLAHVLAGVGDDDGS